VSEQRWPRVYEDGNGWWFVVLSPTSYFSVPDRLTAERCAAAEEMEELLEEYWRETDGTPYVPSDLSERTAALLKRLDEARKTKEQT